MPRRRARFKTTTPDGGKTRPASRRRWVAAFLFAAAAAILLGNAGFRTLVKNTLLLRRISAELEQEKLERRDLESRIEAVSKDDREIEKAARRELGYLKPGEIEYRFPPPGTE